MHSSAHHVFEVLRLVCANDEASGVTEISRRLSLPVSTTHRALTTLERTGYVRRTESAKYEIGNNAERLAFGLLRRFPIREAAQPFLRQIAAATDGTTSLHVRLGWFGIRIASIFSESDTISKLERLGEPHLLHQSIGSTVLLTMLPSGRQNAYRAFVASHYAQMWDKFADETVAAQGLEIRRSGFAYERAAPMHDVFAVPVRDPDGCAIAAVTVQRMKPGRAPIATDSQLVQCMDVVSRLESVVRSKMDALRDPYAHLDPDTILLDVKSIH
ncbi:MAG TPA: helix-turn-helix domain-containing protein [Alphaproteobacteria bacterium]|nr:helix-turn-helix domain-containing protein [Alphaproteobacteria bacterium]